MKHNISVEGIKIYAFHGCLDEESKIGGNYVVDVFIETDFTNGAMEDDLQHTVDYVTVHEIVRNEMAIRSKLIEAVGNRILNKLKSVFSSQAKFKVIIHKLNPPINGNVDSVSVTISEF